MPKKKNTVFIFLLIVFIVFFLVLQNGLCQQNNSEIKLFLDGDELDTDTPPVLINNQIFIPARDIVEALGGRITWFPALKLLNINTNDKEISVVIDVREAEINGEKMVLTTPAKIIDNRVMLPLEVIGLLAEIEMAWDQKTGQLNMTRKKPFINKIRHYTHPDKIRIVIDVSEKSPYQVVTLSNPDRIVVDINGSISQLNPEEREVPIDDRLVSQVRVGQFDRETVRVVTDLKDNYEYQVFDLSSPQRIVVDVFIPENQISTIVQSEITEKAPTFGASQGDGEGENCVIVIDPGHGGKDPGAIGSTGLKEKEVTLDVALQAKKILQKDGFTVHLTRDTDVYIPLEKRPLMALEKGASVFISIHVNSVLRKGSNTARGIETYVLNSRYIGASAKDVADRENKASQNHHYEDTILNQIIADLEESASISFGLELADVVQKKLVQTLNLENRGVKQAPFIVLKGVNMAAILLEVGFLSNSEEEALLKDQNFRIKIAQALSQAVKDYVNTMSFNI